MISIWDENGSHGLVSIANTVFPPFASGYLGEVSLTCERSEKQIFK